MNWIASLITWVSELIGNFGWTIVLFVCVSQLILIPFKQFAKKNAAAKQACDPEIRDIRTRYNANQLGVSMDDSPDMPPEIKAMSHDERSEAMANEISAVYKKHGYNFALSWLPTVINLVVLILLWMGIGAANSNAGDFYAVTFRTLNQVADIDYTWNIIFLAASPALSLLSAVIGGIIKCTAEKRKNKPIKPILIATLISGVLSTALSVWISTSISTAIAIALTTLHAWTIIEGNARKILHKESADVE